MANAPSEQFPQHIIPRIALKNAQLFAERVDMLEIVPKSASVLEVGVLVGDFSEILLCNIRPSEFYAVDSFELHKRPEFWGMNTLDLFSGKTHEQFYRRRFAPEIARGLMHVVAASSRDALPEIYPKQFDMIYLAANRSYESAKQDLENAARLLKKHGVIFCTDYSIFDPFTSFPLGVVRAVNEFCAHGDWEVLGLSLQANMFCDIAIRRR